MGEVELVNRQVLEYFGKTTAELKNWATSDAVHPDDPPQVIDAWRRSVETGQPHDLELRQRRADGAYRWFHSRALPARDTEGRITGWYMLLTDVDERKRAQEKLGQDERELRQLMDFLPQHVLVLDTPRSTLTLPPFRRETAPWDDVENLRAQGVTHVINLRRHQNEFIRAFPNLWRAYRDDLKPRPPSFYERALWFYGNVMRDPKTKIFVMYQHGYRRSPTLVYFFLTRPRGLPKFAEAAHDNALCGFGL